MTDNVISKIKIDNNELIIKDAYSRENIISLSSNLGNLSTSLDTLSYSLSTSLENYLPLSGGSMIGSISDIKLSTPLEVIYGGIGVSTASQNTFFAAPIDGNGEPSFRTIDANDLPITTAVIQAKDLTYVSGNTTINSFSTGSIYCTKIGKLVILQSNQLRMKAPVTNQGVDGQTIVGGLPSVWWPKNSRVAAYIGNSYELGQMLISNEGRINMYFVTKDYTNLTHNINFTVSYLGI